MTTLTPVQPPPPAQDPTAAPAPPSQAQGTPTSFLGHLRHSIAAMVVLVLICCAAYPALVWAIAQAAFPVQANGSLVSKDGTPTVKDSDAIGSSLLAQGFGAPQYFHPRTSAAGNGYDATNSGGSNYGPLSDKLINGLTATVPPATQPAATQAAGAVPTTQAVPAVAAAPATAPAASQPSETLSYDGIRLRAIHYAVDNGINFKLFNMKAGKRVEEVPLAKYLDKDGNLLDVALVDAFPHPATDAADRVVLVADEFSTPIPADAVTASASGLDPHISPRNAALQLARVAKARNVSADAVQKLVDQFTDHPVLGILGDPGVNVLLLNLALDKAAPLAPPAPAVPATTAPAAAAPGVPATTTPADAK